MELLIAIAILSTIAAMAVFALSSPLAASREAVEFRNATQFCDTHMAARAAGAEFQSTTIEGLLDELADGIYGKGAWAQTEFRLNIAPGDRLAVLRRCQYDAGTGSYVVR